GHKPPELIDHWQAVFQEQPGESRVLDIASGAGSIYADLPNNHLDLHATDISIEALKLQRKRITGVSATACGADQLPFPSNRFDLIVSQFGIEYAGLGAFLEAVRVLAPEGRMVLLCHYRNGYVDSRMAPQLTGARIALQSRFTDKAAELVKARLSGTGNSRFQRAKREFMDSERELAASLDERSEGIHVHLYQGFKKMYENYLNYREQDILNWLRDVQVEVRTSAGRLSEMDKAAMSEEEVVSVCRALSLAGCRNARYEPFTTSRHELPLAWSLSASK
ncbi:MAG: class I SAM-dependent methyltransferase, partial [Gammaproteobacteria bacterium]|nr:class I SAM-dependent methyltransferase [Gammaproteobacteria bacterium]